jgi:hypothetical protein
VNLISSSISEHLVRALQNTLLEVEATAGVSPDDPALLDLKRIVLQRIPDLQLAKAQIETSDCSASENSLPSAQELEVPTETA